MSAGRPPPSSGKRASNTSWGMMSATGPGRPAVAPRRPPLDGVIERHRLPAGHPEDHLNPIPHQLLNQQIPGVHNMAPLFRSRFNVAKGTNHQDTKDTKKGDDLWFYPAFLRVPF